MSNFIEEKLEAWGLEEYIGYEKFKDYYFIFINIRL